MAGREERELNGATGAGSGARKILIAEDSPTQACRLAMLLEGAGYDTAAVTNGAAGLEAVRSAPPDLIVSDVMMPEMDGYEFCRAVKQCDSTKVIPFVLLTSNCSPADMIRGLECGADNFITKPYEESYLLERLDRIFTNLEMRRERRLEMEVTIRVNGRQLILNADKQQIVELLLARSEELSGVNAELAHSKRTIEEYARSLEEMVESRTRQLSAAEAKYRTLVEQMPAVTYTTAVDGAELTYISPRCEQMLGVAAAELLSSSATLDDLIHGDDRDRVVAAKERTRRSGQPSCEEYRMALPGGRTIWVRDEALVVSGEPGRADCVQAILLDITERKLLEEQLRQSQKMEAMGRLAAGVAHDFNNMLSVMMGYCEMLSLRLHDRKHADMVDQIFKAGERAAALVRHLLAFSRKQVVKPVVVDVNGLVAGMEKMLRRLIGEDIDFRCVLDPELRPILLDAGQFEQVVMNLVVNARDAMPAGGRLLIETRNVELDQDYVGRHVGASVGPHALIAVTDTGTGMDAETQAHVFEPFFTTKEVGKGTGLGLATTYGIVKQSGGHVHVYSEKGRGTTFKIYFPWTEQAKNDAPGPDARHAVTGGSETVLLVEDDAALRKLITEMIESGGYRVHAADCGEEALRLMHEHGGKIDLLLTDVVMPGMGGRELATRLQRERPELPVVFMSGYSEDAISNQGVLLPGVTLVNKPMLRAPLLRALRESLQGRGRAVDERDVRSADAPTRL